MSGTLRGWSSNILKNEEFPLWIQSVIQIQRSHLAISLSNLTSQLAKATMELLAFLALTVAPQSVRSFFLKRLQKITELLSKQ